MIKKLYFNSENVYFTFNEKKGVLIGLIKENNLTEFVEFINAFNKQFSINELEKSLTFFNLIKSKQ